MRENENQNQCFIRVFVIFDDHSYYFSGAGICLAEDIIRCRKQAPSTENTQGF